MIKLRKIFTVFMLMLFFVLGTTVFAEPLILKYDGEEHEYTGNLYTLMINEEYIQTTVQPLIFNDYTLVPIRDVFEAIGATVKYIDMSQEIFINYEQTYLRLKIGEETALVGDKIVPIPGGITPMLISVNGSDAKTMVPLRFVSENLGFKVDFIAEEGLIKIDIPKKPEHITLNDYRFIIHDDNTVMLKVYADKPIESMTPPKLTNSNVLYFDIDNCKYNLPNVNEINTGAIKSLRFGTTDNKTRIAIDTVDMGGYEVRLSNTMDTIFITVTLSLAKEEEKEEDNKDGEDENKEPLDKPVDLGGKIVIIDAGHGGTDPGALGVIEDVTYSEKDLDLTVATKVVKILKENGVSVVMTREGDTYPSLDERYEMANLYNAVIFTSIHANSTTTPTPEGFEVYYSTLNNSEEMGLSSEELAKAVSKEIGKNVETKNRGVKTADHVVTKNCTMPAILIEMGFMSNPQELALMLTEEFSDAFAKGIADGILKAIDKVELPEEE